MVIQSHNNRQRDATKWMLILVLAVLVTLASRIQVVGVTNIDLKNLALPKANLSNQLEAHEPSMRSSETPSGPSTGDDGALFVWQRLLDHEKHDWDAAIEGWKQIRFPWETDVWRHLAVAAANLEKAELIKTSECLSKAIALQPDNAVVHYFTGLLRLKQAAVARQWPEAVGPTNIRLAAYSLPNVVPNTKNMYEFCAMMELERAVEIAHELDWFQPLVPSGISTVSVQPPTLADLLTAIGADQFATNAHEILARLCLERGLMERAQEHLDKARAYRGDIPAGDEHHLDTWQFNVEAGRINTFSAHTSTVIR